MCFYAFERPIRGGSLSLNCEDGTGVDVTFAALFSQPLRGRRGPFYGLLAKSAIIFSRHPKERAAAAYNLNQGEPAVAPLSGSVLVEWMIRGIVREEVFRAGRSNGRRGEGRAEQRQTCRKAGTQSQRVYGRGVVPARTAGP